MDLSNIFNFFCNIYSIGYSMIVLIIRILTCMFDPELPYYFLLTKGCGSIINCISTGDGGLVLHTNDCNYATYQGVWYNNQLY